MTGKKYPGLLMARLVQYIDDTFIRGKKNQIKNR